MIPADDPIRSALATVFKPKDRRSIPEWAHDNLLELPPVLTVRGQFDVSGSRQLIGPFDALADDHVRQVVVRKPVRGAGTLISDVWHSWCRANDPGPAMAIFQSDKVALDHGQHRLIWLMLHCEQIKALLSSNRHLLKNSQITFADGLPFYVTGPGINNLQTKGIRFMSISESWLPAVGRMLEEAEARLGDFARAHTSKLYLDSQAGAENDPLDARFNEGDQCEWTVQCAGCGKHFETRWSGQRDDGSRWGMRWDKATDSRGNWDTAKVLDTVRFECQHCGHPHIDNARTKAEWNRTGQYLAKNTGAARTKRSFHYSAVIFDPWQALVERYLKAINLHKLGIIEPLIEFFQKYPAEPASEGGLQERLTVLPKAKYVINSAWADEFIRFMTVDVQETHFWIVVRAWSRTGESRRLCFARKYAWTEVEQLQADLKVNDGQVIIDSGYRTREVYSQSCKHGAWTRLSGVPTWIGWHPVKGEDEPYFLHRTKQGNVQRSYSDPTTVDAEAGVASSGQASKCQLFRWSNPRIKDRMAALLKAGRMLSPEDDGSPLEREYSKQMRGEFKKRAVNKKTGREEFLWVRRGDNHAFDCECLSVLGAVMGGLIPDGLEEPEPKAESAAQETSNQ